MVAASPTHDLPSPDTVEISLFGPLYGECLVVHYGQGRWLTVDSCLEKDGTPSALAYLSEIGVSPTAVTHNVITHPDGDHIGGISKLHEACSSARLVCPAVLAQEDMVAYIAYYAQLDPTPLTQKTKELRDVLSLSLDRTPKGPRYVKQDTLIVASPPVRITALAPSDAKVGKFLSRVSMMIPRKGMDRRAPSELSPNEVSAAVIFESPKLTAILGADLEETPGQGWTDVIVNSQAFAAAEKASYFKIAHHGSDNADNVALWNHFTDPIAVLAPFKHGRHKIPTPTGVQRILARTRSAFSSGSFVGTGSKRLSANDRALASHGITRAGLFANNGHVRFRMDALGGRSIALFGGAVHLSRVH